MKNTQVEIYEDKENGIEVKVMFDYESIWLNSDQIAQLYNVQRPAIVKHIINIYKSKELKNDATCSVLEQVAKDGRLRKQNFYNLDMIISVGYRVNSIQATKFRIWSTNVLKQYLVDGYAVNQKLLQEKTEQLERLKLLLSTLANVNKLESFDIKVSKELIRIVADYSNHIDLLDKFDKHDLYKPKFSKTKKCSELKYKDAVVEINKLRSELNAGDLFGIEKDDGFKSALKTILQSFGGKDLYPSIQEKAVNLLDY